MRISDWSSDVCSSDLVLMMAWMNAETLRQSLTEGRTVFWSRSRQEVWRKGDTSGGRQFVREAYYDCDGDTLLFVAEQEGKIGRASCRERVGQYGEILVVAISLTKKIEIKTTTQ